MPNGIKFTVTEASSEGRRRNMAAIRSKNTQPEMFVRRRVHAAGFRFRLHRRDLPGHPDIVFPRYRLVAFVHGCFWHGHDCDRARRPSSNREYWDAKIEGNLARDHRNAGLLKQAKWEVSTIRECTLSLDTECLISQLVALRDKAERHSL